MDDIGNQFGLPTQGARLQPPPPGFTDDQWRTFWRDGLLCLEDALSPKEVAHYLAAARECVDRFPAYDPEHTWKIRHLVQEHLGFRELIDHPRHLGYAYDLYGDQVQLIQSDIFMRPTHSSIGKWHVDGPRVVPYRAFSPHLPLKLRIGYWLTDVVDPAMGNLVYVPGSHRSDIDAEHTGTHELPGQKVLCCRAGTLTIFHCSLWHRVMQNEHPRTRVNLFLSYAPSWIAGYSTYDPIWLETLTREQRIILRAYAEKEDHSRPPPADLPLFDDPGAAVRGGETEIHKVRRRTRYERRLAGIV